MSKKMSDIDVVETSGVDHPAHLHEGFLVMKSADPHKASALLALGKDTKMTGQTKTVAPTVKSTVAADAELVAEAVAKAIDSKLQPLLDSIAEVWQGLRTYGEAQDDSTPTPDGAQPAEGVDPMAAAAADGADLLKAMPEEFRKALDAQRAELAKTRDDLAKERDARLDEQAIAKAAREFPNLGLSEEVVKAVRRVEAQDADLHKALVGLLTASNAQLDGAPLLKELGGTGSSSTAKGRVEELAKELVLAGTHDTIQKARVAVFESHPDLVAQMREEGN